MSRTISVLIKYPTTSISAVFTDAARDDANDHKITEEVPECSGVSENTILKVIPDDCNNVLGIFCMDTGDSDSYLLCYDGMRVGQCCFDNGINFYEFTLTGTCAKRFKTISWMNCNPVPENNRYTILLWKFDCISFTGTEATYTMNTFPVSIRDTEADGTKQSIFNISPRTVCELKPVY